MCVCVVLLLLEGMGIRVKFVEKIREMDGQVGLDSQETQAVLNVHVNANVEEGGKAGERKEGMFLHLMFDIHRLVNNATHHPSEDLVWS